MKRVRLILPGSVILVCLVVLVASAVPRDPIYQGRPISQWIDALSGEVLSSPFRLLQPVRFGPRILDRTSSRTLPRHWPREIRRAHVFIGGECAFDREFGSIRHPPD